MGTQAKVAKGQSVRTRAHSSSVQIAAQDITNELLRVLGKQLLAVIVEKTDRSVIRWATGDSKPSSRDERRLRDTYHVYALLTQVEGDHTIRAWFMGMNPQLEDQAPAEALAEDRSREVLAAARAFANGG